MLASLDSLWPRDVRFPSKWMVLMACCFVRWLLVQPSFLIAFIGVFKAILESYLVSLCLYCDRELTYLTQKFPYLDQSSFTCIFLFFSWSPHRRKPTLTFLGLLSQAKT